MASVFLGTHKASGTQVAIKIVDKENLLESHALQFHNEVAILFKSNHDNILSIIECFETDAQAFLVTKFCPG